MFITFNLEPVTWKRVRSLSPFRWELAAQATPIKLHTVPLSFLTLASISAPIPAAADLYSTAPVGAKERDWAVVVEIFVAPVGDVGFPLTGKFAGVVQVRCCEKPGFMAWSLSVLCLSPSATQTLERQLKNL